MTFPIGLAGGGTQTLIGAGVGTPIGDMINLGGLAAAFDGTTSQDHTTSASRDANVVVAFVGKNWGAGVLKIVTGFKAWGSSDEGFSAAATPTITITLQGSTDNFSVSIVDLGATAGDTDSNGLLISKLTGIVDSAGYQYHRLKIESTVSNRIDCAEAQFFENV